jgi:predicted glutamine amidotransferase
VLLQTLVCEPPHSLLRQCRHAAQAHTETHVDGFGLGWYGDGARPAVYRDATPAWSNQNLKTLCSTVRSGLFFAHVRAATGTPITRENCHPFRLGRYLFMHNGQIGGYATLRRELETLLPDHLFEHRKGATDSELLFLLAIARIELGEDPIRAVIDVFEETARRVARARVGKPVRFSAALADGQALYAFRLSSDDSPPSLYLRSGEGGTVLASEPLDDGPEPWAAVPAGGVVKVTRSAYMVQQAEDLTQQLTAF